VANHTVWRRFEEKLWTLREVHTIVEVAATRRFRFFHPRIATAMVRNTGGPDLLRADRWQQTLWESMRRVINRAQLWHRCRKKTPQIVAGDQLVERKIRRGIPSTLIFQRYVLLSFVELQVDVPGVAF